MFDLFNNIFDTKFMPHGHCYLWDPTIVWTNALSDSIIALSYLTIPISLLYIVKVRKDINFVWLLTLFALFILGCGSTHVMDVINIWKPFYRLDSALRSVTAVASLGTAIMLIKIIPKILLIPNPEIYKKINNELQEKIRTLEEKDKTIELLKKNREMEIALKKSESIFETMVDNIANLAWTANADGYITWYNKRWYAYTGTKPQEVEGWNWQGLIEPNQLPEVVQQWTHSIQTGSPFEMIIQIKNTDGFYNLFLSKAMPVKDDEGKVINWVGTNTDITLRIRSEEELKQKNKELQIINNDLDNFIYTASHDLKAPIANIEGLLNGLVSLRGNRVEEEEQTLMDMIATSISKFKTTISDMAEITKLQKNESIPSEIVMIDSLIEEVKDSINYLIIKTEASIEYKLKNNSVLFSKKNLRSIVYNLISNGIQYRDPSRKPVIVINTEQVNDYFIISVRDNGLGIDLSKQDHIFKMFKRLHDHVEGSGIGLYIVKKIIDNNGGKIEIESTIGQGSTFKVYLLAVPLS